MTSEQLLIELNEYKSKYDEKCHAEHLKETKRLFEKYLNSPLTKEIVETICSDGSTQVMPLKVVINSKDVVAIHEGNREIRYNFFEHRVPELEMFDRVLVEPPHIPKGLLNSGEDITIVKRTIDLSPLQIFSTAVCSVISNFEKNIGYSIDRKSDGSSVILTMIPYRQF